MSTAVKSLLRITKSWRQMRCMVSICGAESGMVSLSIASKALRVGVEREL